jgi:hypothetical protein
MKKNSILIFTICLLALESKSQPEIIPISLDRNKTHVTIKIGDIVIPHILLDSGFPFEGVIIYNPAYTDSLDLTHAIHVSIGGAGGGSPSTALMIDSSDFFLGNIPCENQRILMLQNDIYKGYPSNGIIGYTIFGNYKTYINYDALKMTLYSSSSLPADNSWTEIPLYFKENTVPWTQVSVVIQDEEPVQLSVYIDFAANHIIELLEKPDMKFPMPENTAQQHLGRGLSGDIDGKTGIISKLIIGGYELKNISAAFAPAQIRSKQDDADAILGSGCFRNFNIIFDYENNTLYLKPNSSFIH